VDEPKPKDKADRRRKLGEPVEEVCKPNLNSR
jgi:hypothetical protein